MKSLVSAVLLGCLTVFLALAQFDSGQIGGFVRDPSQSVVADLFVGSYSVEAQAPGFRRSVQSGINLSAAAKLSIDIELAVGAVSESVEVSGAANLVATETATVGRTVDNRQIENLT